MVKKKTLIKQMQDLSIDLIRIYVGLFIFLKGVHFLIYPEMLSAMVNSNVIQFWSAIAGHYVVLAHLSGGLLIAFGLLTRIACMTQIPILLGAVFMIHLHEGFFSANQNLEYACIMLFLLILLSIVGAGPLSVDSYVLKEAKKSRRI